MRHIVLGRTRHPHIQFVRYFFVGGTSAVVDLIAYTILLKFFGVHYLAAAFFAYMVGLTWNHLLCLLWVFESRHSRLREVTMVFLIALGGLVWTEVILYALVGFMGLGAIVAKVISQGLVLIWNFGMRKAYVFH
jgi:putative flippase GtrA